MPFRQTCPKCGAEIAGAALEGLCPKCVGALVLASEPAPAETAVVSASLTEKPGDRIGRYKLLQQIGEGGCGVVYMAQQEEPVRRQVALKVIKLGMDTKNVIARFEAERQALALMDHPNIAKVFDAGATETGRPFFVMELVRGIKFTEYCDQNELSTRGRLELFIQVCQAIQHAHQKGVIHRDIKPSNILVTLRDGVPVPKVIDFGIAKATTDQLLTEKTVFTEFQQFLGTPAYMSPEQAEMSELGIDTRSDIYSLGILLYELLTGKTPFEAKDLLRAGVDEIRRIIREQEPMRPSTRLSTMMAGELTTTAQRRQTQAPILVKLVRGDLDWIVMKCLEKDRGRRYETTNGLAGDVQRYLNSEPVLARPPSLLYELQKTVRRHKFGFAAAGAVTAAMLIGLAVSLALLVKEKAARKRAVAAEKKAQTEAGKSQKVAKFLNEMLQGVGPLVVLGRDTALLREILDEAAERVGIELTDQPDVEAQLRTTIGSAYDELGDSRKAEGMFLRALELNRKLWGEQSTNVAGSLVNLSRALHNRQKFVEAEATLRQALAIQRKLLGEENAQVAETLYWLAYELHWQGKPKDAEPRLQRRFAEAEPHFRKALALAREFPGANPSRLDVCLVSVGDVLRGQGKCAEAETFFREAVTNAIQFANNDPARLQGHINDVVDILWRQGKLTETALEELSDAIAPASILGQPAYLTLLSSRAELFARHGLWQKAAKDAAQLVQSEPTNHVNYHRLAPLLARVADVDGYRVHCQRAALQFGGAEQPNVAERMAKDCLILPHSGVDLSTLSDWANTAVSAGKVSGDLPWFQFCKGLAEYRQGNFESAADWNQKVLAHRGDIFERDVEACMVLAMAQYRSNHADDARATLAKGLEIAESKLAKLDSGDLGNGWIDWIIAQSLVSEAKALIAESLQTSEK